MVYKGQAVIGRILQTCSAESQDELIRRLDRHLLVRAAIDQKHWRHPGRNEVHRRGLFVGSSPHSFRRPAHELADYFLNCVVLVLISQIDRPAVADYRSSKQGRMSRFHCLRVELQSDWFERLPNLPDVTDEQSPNSGRAFFRAIEEFILHWQTKPGAVTLEV
jgi:hypothetical protein